MKTRTKASAAFLVVAAAWSAQAQDPASGIKVPASSGQRFETLRPDNSFPDWRRISQNPTTQYSEPSIGYSYVSDPLAQEVTSGIYHPLAEDLSSLLETSRTAGLQGMPERSVLGQIGKQFGHGWGMQAGLRHSEIGLGSVDLAQSGADWQASRGGTGGMANLGMLTFERYWDHYRGAYTFFGGRTDSGSLATGHRVQLHYFYSERSSVGLAYTTGRPIDPTLGLGNAVAADVNNIGVTGEHWISPSWAINYNAGINYNVLTQEPGVSGLKPEFRLGLRLRF